MNKKTTVLMILDGLGISEIEEGNAVMKANTPNLDKLMKDYPYKLGNASGLFVGLPEGQMGNSEVGHLNMGAGRIIYQELTRITKSISDGDFFDKKEFLDAIENCKKNNSALHLFGLLSDGGVHSHINHLFALLELAKKNNLDKVYVHAFMDGRDTAPTSGLNYIKQLENKISEIGVGKIATISGRYYAMDRDNRYERVEIAYNTIANGKGETSESALKCMEDSYKKDINDEFILPTVILENNKPTGIVNENDSIIFFNFRPDRARELTRAFCDEKFEHFNRKKGLMKLFFVTLTEYDITINNKVVVYKNSAIENTLGEYISSLGLSQLRMAETEKYAHVTFFFNGGIEEEYKNESRILVPSPKVATYDLQPEMNAEQLTDKFIEALESKKHDFIVINYANPDMVGHTGKIDAAIKAIEEIDKCLGRNLEALLKVNGQMFLCADHGNSEKMLDYTTHEVFTAHSTNPVPFILINADGVKDLKENGRLCDIAPTLLDIMNISQPKEMEGNSLVIR